MIYCKFIYFLLFFTNPVQNEFVHFDKENVEIQNKGNQIEITLPFEILEGYYIQEEKDVPDNIIPTTVSFQSNLEYKISGYTFLSEERKSIVLDKTTHQVFNKNFSIKVSLILDEKTRNKTKKLAGEVNYQACNEKQCFYPRRVKFDVDLFQ